MPTIICVGTTVPGLCWHAAPQWPWMVSTIWQCARMASRVVFESLPERGVVP